jgi:hypothetical protein
MMSTQQNANSSSSPLSKALSTCELALARVQDVFNEVSRRKNAKSTLVTCGKAGERNDGVFNDALDVLERTLQVLKVFLVRIAVVF